ncbi:hypothetical protein PIB30_092823 [Stylosanthes scabra]|uniref:Uncharacterized protein n=1 Tax=Stylosanthes scabra TaxID=79078 RepID=A0ABU6UTR2_9FABA|nr:hypothetical protein [Stylosanthes scabra]
MLAQLNAVFLEGLMDEAGWYEDPTKQPLLISDYKIIEPEVVQQDPGSNDAGVFVAQWMIMHYLWGTYDVERVSAYSRMRLAIDIVLKDHNADRLAFTTKLWLTGGCLRLSHVIANSSLHLQPHLPLYIHPFLEDAYMEPNCIFFMLLCILCCGCLPKPYTKQHVLM